MAVAGTAELTLINLGVMAPYPGNPDGLISGNASIVHDASGGGASLTLTAEDVGEILIKIVRTVIKNPTATSIAVPIDFLLGAPSVLYGTVIHEMTGRSGGGSVAAENIRSENYPEGVWFLTDKNTSVVLRLDTPNTNGAAMQLQLLGWYWRMTRLRMHGPEDWRTLIR